MEKIYWFEFHSEEQIVDEIFKLYNNADVGEVIRVGGVSQRSLPKILSVLPHGKCEDVGRVFVVVKLDNKNNKVVSLERNA
jgi:hypothetical protein